jgi:RNA polymerase primary sigma factor
VTTRDKKLTGELETVAGYLRAARGLPPMSREEGRELARRAREGDAPARDELVRRHLPMVVTFARKQSRHGVRLDELVQEGNLGLLRAIEKFDPRADVQFSTYALWWVRAYVWKHLKLARSTVRPRSGTAALADYSLDGPLGDSDDDASWLELVEDGGPAPEERYAQAEARARVRGALDRVRGRVGELGWDIIHTRLQQDPPDTLEEIGRRWKLSRERVRQVEIKTKRFLRAYLAPLPDPDEAQEAA